MVFSSLEFIFRFMPVFFIIYYFAPAKWRNLVLITGSVIFYALGDLKYTYLVLLSSAVNFFLALLIDRKRLGSPARKAFLIADIVFNVGLLLVFKYTAFFISTINGIFKTELFVPEIALPLGISFTPSRSCPM